MIFKTFNNDIDNWTAKIGVFGKSFNAIFDAKNQKKIDINDLIVYKGMSLDEAKKQVGSFWSYLYPKKEDIQKQLIDIDSLIPEIDKETFDFDHWINELNDMDKQVKDGTKSWQDYSNGLKDSQKWIAKWGQETEGQIRTQSDLVKANQQARASALAHNEAIKAQTFSAKAGKVALQALAIAGNMLAMWAIIKGIELAVKGIDNLIHSTEHCKERVDELMSSYQSALDTANSNAKTVEELAARYEELSKGVNNLGEKVSLTTDEYTEYNKIVNQIADMFPTLVQGYTNEGNAILSLKGNVEQLRDAYKEAQQEAYNLLITDGKDSNGNDIIKNWQNTINGNFWQEGTADIINYLDKLSEIFDTKEELEKFQKTLVNSSGFEVEWFHDFTGLVANFDINDLSDKDLAVIRKKIQAYKQTYQAEINSALKNTQTLANAYLMTNEDYAILDDQAKNAASIIVNSINEGIVSGFESKEDVGAYVIGIVDSIKDNPEIQDALVGLFTLNTSDMQPDNAKALVDQYINFIASELEENPVELKVRLGFEDTDTIASNYRSVMREAAEKFAEKTPSAKESRSLYDAELNELTKFAEENSINTQDEIAFWNKCIEESETREDAMEKYLESPFTSDEPITFSSVLSDESLSKFQSTIDSLKSSLTTLYNGDYSSADLISSLTNINKALSDIGKADVINWEEITNLDDLNDIIDQITNEYVDGMLESLDMAGTDFGNTIRNVIQEELKASRQLETYKSNVSDLQTAYSNLTDVIETYNANGYITFDQLTSLLEMEPQYLSCLIDENGQLQLNEQAMADLAQLRLDEARSQVVQEAISELNRLSEERQTKAVNENSNAYIQNIKTISQWNDALGTAMQNAGLAAPLFAELSAALGGAVSNGASDEAINQVLDNAYKKFQMIGQVQSSIGSNLGGVLGKTSSSSSSASSTDDFKEQFDFFERRVDVLDDAVSLLKANLENLTGSFTKNQLLDQNSNILEERMRNYSDAVKMYQQKAQESLSKLDLESQKKIIDGSVSITDYIGEGNEAVIEAMNDYKGWADKVAECTEELASLKDELRQLELDKFNNIVQDFADQFDLRDNAKNLIDKQIALFEEAGQLIGKSFYEEQIDQSQKQLSLLENEKAQLVNQMSSAISTGRVNCCPLLQ